MRATGVPRRVAAIARTSTFLLLRTLVDDVLGQGRDLDGLWLFALGFVGLAVVEGGATFMRGRLAAEGLVDLLLDSVSVEKGEAVGVELQPAQEVGVHMLQILGDLSVNLTVVHGE